MKRSSQEVELAQASNIKRMALRIVHDPVVEARVWQQYWQGRLLRPEQQSSEAWQWRKHDPSRGSWVLGCAEQILVLLDYERSQLRLYPPHAEAFAYAPPSDYFPHAVASAENAGAALALVSSYAPLRDWYSLALVCRSAAARFHGAASPFHRLWPAVAHLFPPSKRARPWAQLHRVAAPRVGQLLKRSWVLLKAILPSCTVTKVVRTVMVTINGVRHSLAPSGLWTYEPRSRLYKSSQNLLEMVRAVLAPLLAPLLAPQLKAPFF